MENSFYLWRHTLDLPASWVQEYDPFANGAPLLPFTSDSKSFNRHPGGRHVGILSVRLEPFDMQVCKRFQILEFSLILGFAVILCTIAGCLGLQHRSAYPLSHRVAKIYVHE